MWFRQLVEYIARAEAPSVSFLRKFIANELVFAESDGDGNTLLHHYCKKHPLDAEILCLFRAMQCDFSRGNLCGLTPLHLMVQNPSVSVELLQIAGGNYRVATRDGYTPLHHYCLQPHFDTAVFEWLLERSDALATTVSHNGIPHLLAMNKAVPLPFISEFLRNEGELDHWMRPNLYGETPLDHVATYRGERYTYSDEYDPNAVQDMLALGAVDVDKWFHHATRAGDVKSMKALLDAGADINCQSHGHPLHAAVSSNSIEAVQFLVENEANVNCFNWYDRTPLELCMEYPKNIKKRMPIARYLRSKGACMKHSSLQGYLLTSIEQGEADAVEFLIKEGADIKKDTYLHYACNRGHLDVVKVLLDKGADVDAMDNGYWTALDYACNTGHLDVAKYLYAHQAKLTSIMICMAARNGHVEVLEWLLIFKQLDINFKWDEKTALYWAAAAGHCNTVELLLKKGASKTIRCENRTAADIAKVNGHSAVLKLLE